MEPTEAISLDRSTFENELDELIDSVRSESILSPTPKRSAVQEAQEKRLKTELGSREEQALAEYSLHVHPSRRVLLDRPNTPRSNCESEHVDTDSIPGRRSNQGKSKAVAGGQDMTGQKHQYGVRRRSCGKPRADNATLKTSVWRQWDERLDVLGYDVLLQQRRKESLTNVDRYVPDASTVTPRIPATAARHGMGYSKASSSTVVVRKHFPLERLPKDIMARILEILLVSPDPIKIDLYWLRPFVKGHARVPTVTQKVVVDGTTYTILTSWNKVLGEVQALRDDMDQFRKALETRGEKTKAVRSPAKGLSTALLRVSRSIHETAALVFYGRNTFRFSCATSAWMQLESFFSTIGPKNTGNIQHIRVHAPLWYLGIHEDFVEGANIDLLSPASRLAVIKPPARDRLVSAIQAVKSGLHNSPNLKSITLELENTLVADHWSGRYVDDHRLISMSEAEEHANRKSEGISLLKDISEVLVNKERRKPVVTLCHPSKSSSSDRKDFEKRLPSLIKEAEKYGWEVDGSLRALR